MYAAFVAVLSVVIATSIPRNHLQSLVRSAGGRAAAAAAVPTPSTTTTSTTTTDPDRGMPRLLPTTAEPLRVLEIGDSLGIDLGDQLQSQLDAAGLSSTTMASLGDTGLANVSYYDWPAHLATLLLDDRPQLLVVFVGANDDQGLYVDGAAAAPGTPQWLAGYRQRVDSILREATGAGVRVVWVGMPPMADAALNAAIEVQNEIYQQETAAFAGTLYVSSTAVLGNAAGQYQGTAVDGAGDAVTWRTADGVHLTPAGAALLAGRVIDAIDQRWHLALTPRSTWPSGGGR
ncbi:MAG TPA: DUF459 domain-containing protein [Acidimicrobiales bacterium]